MENKEKEYKEERFEFAIFINDDLICKRNFKIYNFIENSMNTYEFKEKVDEIVNLIDSDLKSKSRVYSWYYFNPNEPEANEEFTQPLIKPWECTFKLVIYDNKREVISRIWDGYAYPRYVRNRVDFSNKYVKISTREGQLFTYDKESFFGDPDRKLSFEHYMLKGMIMDKQDVLLQITKKICEACSPTKEDKKALAEAEDSRDIRFIDNYTVVDEYANENGDKSKEYAYSLYLSNRKVERAWEKLLQKKTNKYMKELY